MNDNCLKNALHDLTYADTSVLEFIQSGYMDGIWCWDLLTPESEWISPKIWQTLGYNPDEQESLVTGWQEIVFHEDLKLAIDSYKTYCTDPNHPYDQKLRCKHKNGTTVWIRCRGLAIRDKNGRAMRMLGAYKAITDTNYMYR